MRIDSVQFINSCRAVVWRGCVLCRAYGAITLRRSDLWWTHPSIHSFTTTTTTIIIPRRSPPLRPSNTPLDYSFIHSFIHHQHHHHPTTAQPALGAVFAELLAQGRYTHWGYGDMDMLVSRRLLLPPLPAATTRATGGGKEAGAGAIPSSAAAAAAARAEQHPFAVPAHDLEEYDALTFSFGDQFRGYLRWVRRTRAGCSTSVNRSIVYQPHTRSLPPK